MNRSQHKKKNKKKNGKIMANNANNISADISMNGQKLEEIISSK